MQIQYLVDGGLSIFILFTQGLFAWSLWSLRRMFVRNDDYALHINNDLSEHKEYELFLNHLESRVNSLPNIGEINTLSITIESLRSEIKVVEVRLVGVDRLVSRLEKVLDKQDDILRQQM